MTSRILKMAAFVAYYGFARWLPSSAKPYSLGAKQLRGSCARYMLRSCGQSVNIERGADFGSGAQLSLGDRSGIGLDAQISGPVEIGNDVMMGPNVRVFARNHEFRQLDIPMIEQGFQQPRPVRIGDDVWIGASAIILPGRTIGNGAIVGAGAVVGIDVPAFGIVAGNPAAIVGSRSSRESAVK